MRFATPNRLRQWAMATRSSSSSRVFTGVAMPRGKRPAIHFEPALINTTPDSAMLSVSLSSDHPASRALSRCESELHFDKFPHNLPSSATTCGAGNALGETGAACSSGKDRAEGRCLAGQFWYPKYSDILVAS